jgi:hypothetical protein
MWWIGNFLAQEGDCLFLTENFVHWLNWAENGLDLNVVKMSEYFIGVGV